MSADIFDEEFLAFYDRVRELLDEQGCFHMSRAGLYSLAPDTKVAHEWLDALVAKGRLKRLTPAGTWGQHEVYAAGKS